jgi:hypothetical protein
LTGFAWRPDTSMAALLASLPLLVIHTLAVSLSGYHLIRKVQKQNLRLDELNRIDALTGLETRAHWEAQAEAALAAFQSRAEPSTLMLLDLDRFKEINDRHGHAIGDDVLRAVADVIRRTHSRIQPCRPPGRRRVRRAAATGAAAGTSADGTGQRGDGGIAFSACADAALHDQHRPGRTAGQRAQPA